MSSAAMPTTESGLCPADCTLCLTDIGLRQVVELVGIDLPEEQMEPLLERGLLPGCRLSTLRRSPSGDPIVEVEGVVLALRREMASRLFIRVPEPQLV